MVPGLFEKFVYVTSCAGRSVYMLLCVYSMSFLVYPSCVCLPCVCHSGRSLCMSLCVYVRLCVCPPCVCLVASCVGRSVCMSLRVYVALCVYPLKCMSSMCMSPPCVCPFRTHVSRIVMSLCVCHLIWIFPWTPYSHTVCIIFWAHTNITRNYFFKQACRFGSSTNLKLLRVWVRPPAGCQCSKIGCQPNSSHILLIGWSGMTTHSIMLKCITIHLSIKNTETKLTRKSLWQTSWPLQSVIICSMRKTLKTWVTKWSARCSKQNKTRNVND